MMNAPLTRRAFLGATAAASAGAVLPSAAASLGGCAYAPDLRDRCWMWGHDSRQYDSPIGHYRIPLSPDISMADACAYMGIPNVSVVRWSLPDERYCAQFRNMKRVAWVADSGSLHQHGRDILPTFLDFGFRHLETMPNLTGFDFDDFFDQPRKPLRTEKLADGTPVPVLPGSRTLDELRSLRTRFRACRRPLDMRLVFYERDLDHLAETKPVVDLFDTVMFWTWYGKNVDALRANFMKFRTIAAEKTILLGIYMWDFGGARPLGVETMRGQLACAIDLFRHNLVQGFVFHCTPLVNKGLPEVEMCRAWIAAHGGERIGSAL